MIVLIPPQKEILYKWENEVRKCLECMILHNFSSTIENILTRSVAKLKYFSSYFKMSCLTGPGLIAKKNIGQEKKYLCFR
jgi:hypothetical protein